MKQVSIYYATAYVRTSKDEDGSNSIENQADLILEYVDAMPEINIVSVREDSWFGDFDDFLRPSFVKMLEDITAGKINCVIVEDLSRLGRNYIEVGELMLEVFPRYNVRLIAVNDYYDSLNAPSDFDDIIILFKNLLNEYHLRDTSVKIRSDTYDKKIM